MMPMRPRNSLPPGNRACSLAGNTPHSILEHTTMPTIPAPRLSAATPSPDPKGKVTDYGTRSRPAQPRDLRLRPQHGPPGRGIPGRDQASMGLQECGETHTLLTTELEYEQEQRARIAHQPLSIALAAEAPPCKSGAPSRPDRYLPLSSRCPRDDHGLPF